MPYKLKLTKPGGETRRLTFNVQPSWLDLETKIGSLFDIQNKAVAVSYEDRDGDVVTMSSQEELQDYFQSCYKSGQVAKFTVIDKTQSQRPMSASAFVEDLDEGTEGGLPTMGPTMVLEVDDGGWQRLARIPEIFDIPEEDDQTEPGERHAFVEVLDSDAASSKKGSDPASSEHTPNNGIATRQLRHKGKQRASPRSEATKSTSSASVVDDDFPMKPPVHVYDVSDAGRSPRGSVQGLPDRAEYSAFEGVPGVESLMGSFGTVYPVSPPQDAFKHVPRASDFHDASERNPFHLSTSVHSDSVRSTQPTSGRAPTVDLEDPSSRPNGTGGSRTPTLEQMSAHQPSFVHDVANLVDSLTDAFASHPELSEGVRNIVRNAVGGIYWRTERDRIASAAENVRVAAEETSERISQVAGNMENNAERDAVRMIAEALGGVFHVIGELSGARPVNSSTGQFAAPRGPPPAPAAPPHPHQHAFNPPLGPPSHRHGLRGGWPGPPPPFGYRQGPSDSPRRMSHHGPSRDFGHRPPQPGMPGFESSQPWQPEWTVHQPQRSSTWGPSSYAPHYFGGPSYDNTYGETIRPNVHETKAQLEAAKTVYKAEKERFRQEKEERRRQRREIAEKRAEEGRAQRPDGTTREEQIIARLPLHGYSREGPSKRPYAEIYSVPPHSSGGTTSINPASQGPPVQMAQLVSPRASGTGASVYSAADPAPPVPPAPIPASATIVPPAPSAPPAPPSQFIPPAPMAASNAGRVRASAITPQPTRVASGPGPFPWPMPPAPDPSRRAQLTTLRERIMARLFDMGITTASQPDMMDILNECTSRNDAPNDSEVLADVLSAMNIRGNPSPRAPSSSLPY